MKKYITLIFTLLLVITPIIAFAAGSSNNKCATKYPVILAHGMGWNADGGIVGVEYWNRIPGALEDEGAIVYITSVNALGTHAQKGQQFKDDFLYIKAVSGKSKFNVIGHSHGTIYTRYAINHLGLSPYVASHTSICGPQHGSAVADVLLDFLPDAGEWLISGLANAMYVLLLGDDDPNLRDNAYDLTMDYMNNTFNPNTPNKVGIYYQSYATKIKTVTSNAFMMGPTWLLLLYHEGANDGLVSVNSAKWGEFKGVDSGAWWCGGVDHLNAVDQLFGVTPGFDARQYFVNVVKGLKDKGL